MTEIAPQMRHLATYMGSGDRGRAGVYQEGTCNKNATNRYSDNEGTLKPSLDAYQEIFLRYYLVYALNKEYVLNNQSVWYSFTVSRLIAGCVFVRRGRDKRDRQTSATLPVS